MNTRSCVVGDALAIMIVKMNEAKITPERRCIANDWKKAQKWTKQTYVTVGSV